MSLWTFVVLIVPLVLAVVQETIMWFTVKPEWSVSPASEFQLSSQGKFMASYLELMFFLLEKVAWSNDTFFKIFLKPVRGKKNTHLHRDHIHWIYWIHRILKMVLKRRWFLLNPTYLSGFRCLCVSLQPCLLNITFLYKENCILLLHSCIYVSRGKSFPATAARCKTVVVLNAC